MPRFNCVSARWSEQSELVYAVGAMPRFRGRRFLSRNRRSEIGTRGSAARMLGIPERTLYRRLKEYRHRITAVLRVREFVSVRDQLKVDAFRKRRMPVARRLGVYIDSCEDRYDP